MANPERDAPTQEQEPTPELRAFYEKHGMDIPAAWEIRDSVVVTANTKNAGAGSFALHENGTWIIPADRALPPIIAKRDALLNYHEDKLFPAPNESSIKGFYGGHSSVETEAGPLDVLVLSDPNNIRRDDVVITVPPGMTSEEARARIAEIPPTLLASRRNDVNKVRDEFLKMADGNQSHDHEMSSDILGVHSPPDTPSSERTVRNPIDRWVGEVLEAYRIANLDPSISEKSPEELAKNIIEANASKWRLQPPVKDQPFDTQAFLVSYIENERHSEPTPPLEFIQSFAENQADRGPSTLSVQEDVSSQPPDTEQPRRSFLRGALGAANYAAFRAQETTQRILQRLSKTPEHSPDSREGKLRRRLGKVALAVGGIAAAGAATYFGLDLQDAGTEVTTNLPDVAPAEIPKPEQPATAVAHAELTSLGTENHVTAQEGDSVWRLVEAAYQDRGVDVGQPGSDEYNRAVHEGVLRTIETNHLSPEGGIDPGQELTISLPPDRLQ